MALVISLSAPIGLVASQELVREIQRQSDLPRVPRYVDVDSKGQVARFGYRGETIRGTTYMEWDKLGSGDVDDIVHSVFVRKVHVI